MADILKSLPFLTVEDYLWKYSSSFIRLMAYDQSRIKYLKDGDKKDKNVARAYTADDVLTQLGLGGSSMASATEKANTKQDGEEKTAGESFLQKLRGNVVIK